MTQSPSEKEQIFNEDKPARRLIVAATALEVAPLLKRATLISDTVTQTGRRFMKLTLQPQNSMRSVSGIWLIITGVGTVNAAHAVTQAIEQCKPDLIIQVGIGGAFESAGLDVGDLAVAKSDTDIHVGVEKKPYPHSPLPFDLIEGLPETRHGRFHFDLGLCGKIHEILICYAHGIPCPAPRVIQGDFITGLTLTATPERVKALETAFSPCMESMEGAAVAQVAALYKIPLVQIRAASNKVGIREKSQWNIPLAAHRVCDAVMALLMR